jgi:hypothetical protein
MDLPAVRTDAENFFCRLGLPDGQFRELRLIDPGDSRVVQRYCQSAADAFAIAADASGRLNVYVGACPRSQPSGRREAVTVVPSAWADLDFHQIDPTNRDLAMELAHRRVEALGIPPTLLVHTGNGLQVWWLFHEPVAISDKWPAERFEAINLGLAKRLGGDHVQDLGRVLRVPGTMNLPDARKRARGCVPVTARLIDASGPTYLPENFASISISVPPAPSRHLEAARVEVPQEPNPEVLEAFSGLLEALDPFHPLVRTWRGDRELVDDSRSGWDMALANQLVRAGIRDEFVPHILRAFAKGRGAAANERYLARTITKAQDMFGDSHEATRNR